VQGFVGRRVDPPAALRGLGAVLAVARVFGIDGPRIDAETEVDRSELLGPERRREGVKLPC